MIQPPKRSLVTSLLLLACVALTLVARPAPPSVLAGIDVLVEENFAPLVGRRVGLITNHTGQTRTGESTIDVLARAPGVRLVALFAPEHGLRGTIEEREVPSERDTGTGLPIHSLYAGNRHPTDEMLAGVDVLVFDIQDAGVRFYTHITTMAYAMEEAARRKIAFVVLDRPNPLGGVVVQGPVLDSDLRSFVGYFALPIRHGMTVGELARMFNPENNINVELTVVPMRGWQRAHWFDETGWPWVSPSPNLRSVRGATLYPAVELLRAGQVSVGRGTPTPFELFGAPWIRSRELKRYLDARRIPGVRFERTRFRPAADVHPGQLCYGLRLRVTDRKALDVGRLGVELLSALWRLYPQNFQLEKNIRLLGSKKTLERIRAGDDPVDIVADWQEDLEAFKRRRAPYLLYD